MLRNHAIHNHNRLCRKKNNRAQNIVLQPDRVTVVEKMYKSTMMKVGRSDHSLAYGSAIRQCDTGDKAVLESGVMWFQVFMSHLREEKRK